MTENQINMDEDKEIIAVFEEKEDEDTQIIEFEYENSEDVIREKIDKSVGDIYKEDVEDILELV